MGGYWAFTCCRALPEQDVNQLMAVRRDANFVAASCDNIFTTSAHGTQVLSTMAVNVPHVYELIRAGRIKPELVIGVPVGFVNVIQSKELILELPDTPYIVARGRKGGSNIAACICNALLYDM